MRDFLRDLRYGLRLLIKNPGFTVVALLTLAIGIGATTAMFSVVNGVLLRPLPFRDPGRLVMIREQVPKFSAEWLKIPAPDVVTYARENTSFTGVAGFIPTRFDLTGYGAPQNVAATRVAWNLFSLLGVQPQIGRPFSAQEDHADSYVAIVSYGFWKQHLGGTPDVLGKTVTLNRKPFEIVGVMPQGFAFPLVASEPSDVWVPLGLTATELADFGDNFSYGAIARLKPGVTMVQARADAQRIAQAILQTFPPSIRGDLQLNGVVIPLKEDIVGDVRKPLLVLFLAVMVVLLIAVVNVANLLLARGTARQREMAIRIALGAGGRRLVAQVLAESVMLALAGGALGLLSAVWATQGLFALVPANIPRLQSSGVDGRVLAFMVAVCVLAGLAFGTIPALLALHTSVNDNLKEGGRGTSVGRSHQRVRASLVVAQVALALVLLAGAGLLLRSFQRVLQVDPGFRPQKVITAAVSLSPTQYSTAAQARSFYTELEEKLAGMPGVAAAGLSSDLPTKANWNHVFSVDGYAPPPGAGLNISWHSVVLGDYFRAMGIPLIRGRLFTPTDDAAGQRVVIISQSIVEKYFHGRDPIGGRLKWGVPQSTDPWLNVVGVVGDIKQGSLDATTLPHTYTPFLQRSDGEMKAGTGLAMNMVVRTSGNPSSAAASMRAAVWSLDRQVPVSDIRTMEQVISQSTASRRFNMLLVGFFAVAALLLAAVGLYGVMSYSVSQRTHEIGVRMTLGARRADVLRMVLGSGITLVLIGVAIGVAGALVASRLLTSFLFEVRPSDPITFAAVALVLAAVALVASMAPALRATRVDPMIALRNE